MDLFKQNNIKDTEIKEWKCRYIRGSRWKNDTRMFHKIARARLKNDLRRSKYEFYRENGKGIE